jgi:prepilin-type N-terminal cleavage/methylation domain-containing protein
MFAAHRRGFTLIELLIAVAIIGILSAVGYTYMSRLIPRYRTYQAARDLAGNIEKVRGLAAQDSREYRIALVASDSAYLDPGSDNEGIYYVEAGNRESGSTAWDRLPRDPAPTGDATATDELIGEGTIDVGATLEGVSLVPWDALAGPSYGGESNAECLVFSPRGWLVNPNGDFDTDGYITIEFINKKALTRSQDERYQVHVSRAGMVRVDFNESLYESVAKNGLGIDQRSMGYSSSSGGGGSAD